MQYELVTAEPIAFGIQKGLKISFRGVVVGFLIYLPTFFLERAAWMIYRNRSAIKAQGSNSVEWAKEAGKSAIETRKSDAKKTKKWIKDGFEESESPD